MAAETESRCQCLCEVKLLGRQQMGEIITYLQGSALSYCLPWSIVLWLDSRPGSLALLNDTNPVKLT